MKLPPQLQDQGISQDMVSTLRAITAFRRNDNPRPQSSRTAETAATKSGQRGNHRVR